MVTGILVSCGGLPPEKQAQQHYLQGKVFENQGDFRGAGVEYVEALRLNPRMAEAYVGRGVVCMNLCN